MIGKNIKEEFEEYRKRIIPIDVPDIQIRECKRAFYAGVSSLFALLEIPLTNPNVKKVETISQELLQYAFDVKVGIE